MKEICVQLFGTPTIKYDGQTVVFSLKKAEALFYYLVLKQKVHKDEIIGLLWDDMSQQKARKNLRNALYKVRKLFEDDLIINSKGDVIELTIYNNFKSDSLKLSDNIDNIIEVYKGEFLKSFYVKNAPEYNEWVNRKRRYYKDIYLSSLFTHTKNLYDDGKYKEASVYAMKYIEEDVFDERVYRLLMKIYIDNGMPNKAIELYKRLESRLNTEIGVCPDEDTKLLYKSIIKNKFGLDKRDNLDFFYGRELELNQLKKQFDSFYYNNISRAIFITGEAGIGKTKLKDVFLKNIESKNIKLFKINCCKIEENCPLRPFNGLFEQIITHEKLQDIDFSNTTNKVIKHLFTVLKDDISFNSEINYNYIENSIIDVFKDLSYKKRILLVFENFQWIDDISLNLLGRLLHNLKNNLMVIGLVRDDYKDEIQSFFVNVKELSLFNEIRLSRFNDKECAEFVVAGFSEYKLSDKAMKKIYKETEGNTCFLVEVINTLKHNGQINVLTSKMKDILQGRIMQVSKEGRNLLNIMALFSDVITLNIIRKISSTDEMNILSVIEELQARHIIRENYDNNNVFYTFTHMKLKEFLYMNLTYTKRILLHNKIGHVLKDSLRGYAGDMVLYPKIIYHFKKANNIEDTLRCTMKYADLQLSFDHELFPSLDSSTIKMDKLSYTQKNNTIKLFNDIKQLLELNEKEKGLTVEVKRYRLEFFYMLGRYYIREGSYEQGLKYIQSVIKKSENIIDSNKYKVKAFKQLIYYCIQIHDDKKMHQYLISLKECIYNDIDYAIYLRLKGLNLIMENSYESAELMLNNSINILNKIDEDNPTNLLNIAAAYNYIGDIKRYSKEYKLALSYYNKAIKICYESKGFKGLTIFYTNAGLTSYEMRDYQSSKEYLLKAEEMFEISGSIWKRSICEGILSLIYEREGDNKKSFVKLKKSEGYCDKVKNPLEFEILFRVKEELKALEAL